ncbi:electron transfer flavoprotein subunit beta/FixA family protein [Cohnella rhizosphaerae]|uniref:Electron transfer flavoprotein subunit beta n=1 Tax=Cohnella rhizosphaerae TaxID=1457232 RepID=A0A9X4QW25_9BACL|nr:electron transfer flavoprotein subunit beta/FixA family protein [Cohnella rhizosphaerae]MDG0812082.1 electron transfer flavoprotein subunit beta/FixA family protein [Cohnella rhizosphaerae]
MNMAVLLKQTFDTEEKIVLSGGKVVEEGVKFVVNPYDEYAIEEAIRLKETHGGQVTAISLGPARVAEALRTALAMGADEAIHIDDAGLPQDEFASAVAIAAVLRQQSYDVVLGGSFSVDTGGAQVAVRVAAALGLPHVTSITKLTVNGGTASAERDAEGDVERIDVRLPALFTAQQGLNEPRYPSLPGIMKAKKKPFKSLTAEELGLAGGPDAARTVRVSLSPPQGRQAGQLLQGNPQAQAEALVGLLRAASRAI